MASIFKRDGSSTWTIKYVDENGVRRTRNCAADKRTAEQVAASIEARIERIRLGLSNPREERRLTEERRALRDHVEEFVDGLRARGNTSTHAAATRGMLLRLFGEIHAERLSDLTPARVQRNLGERRERGLSARAANKYLTACRTLLRWAIADGRIAEDPLIGLRPYRTADDRRVVRRALSPEELGVLIAAAESGGDFLGVSGQDRAMLYRIASSTGFRASEIGSLTPESFDFASTPVTVTVKEAYSKNRKLSRQTVLPEFVEQLRPWLATKAPGAPLIALPKPGKPNRKDVKRRMRTPLAEITAQLIRHDLQAAGLPYEDADGRVADFHALRHTFVTTLVQSGASVEETRSLARHASAQTTFGHYTHTRRADLERALERMPKPIAPAPQAAAATGTDGAEAIHQNRHHSAVGSGRESSQSVACGRDGDGATDVSGSANADGLRADESAEQGFATADSEHATDGEKGLIIRRFPVQVRAGPPVTSPPPGSTPDPAPLAPDLLLPAARVPDLLPCPWCGTAKVELHVNSHYSVAWCRGCSAQAMSDPAGGCGQGSCATTAAEATAAWNRVAAVFQPPLRPLLDALLALPDSLRSEAIESALAAALRGRA